MMDLTEMETSPSLSSMESNSGFTLEQFLELIQHFKTDPNPNKESLKALAESLTVTKEDIRFWFLYGRREMELRQLSEAHTSEPESREYAFPSQLVRSSGSDFGLGISLMYRQEKSWEKNTVPIGFYKAEPQGLCPK